MGGMFIADVENAAAALEATAAFGDLLEFELVPVSRHHGRGPDRCEGHELG
jgi:hypothetical protein